MSAICAGELGHEAVSIIVSIDRSIKSKAVRAACLDLKAGVLASTISRKQGVSKSYNAESYNSSIVNRHPMRRREEALTYNRQEYNQSHRLLQCGGGWRQRE